MSKKKVPYSPYCGYNLHKSKDGSLAYTYNIKDFSAIILRYMDSPDEDGWAYFVDDKHDIDFTDIILN